MVLLKHGVGLQVWETQSCSITSLYQVKYVAAEPAYIIVTEPVTTCGSVINHGFIKNRMILFAYI